MTGIEPPAYWSATERAVWDALSAGRPADLDVIVGGPAPGIDDDAGWAAATDRTLSRRFVEDLFSAAYVTFLPEDVTFIGAYFENEFIVESPTSTSLTFIDCVLFGFALSGTTVAGSVKFKNVHVAYHISLTNLIVGGDLAITAGRIGGKIILRDTIVKGEVSIQNDVVYYGNPYGQEAQDDNGDLKLGTLLINGNLAVSGSTLEGSLRIQGVVVRQAFTLESTTVSRNVTVIHSACRSMKISPKLISGDLLVSACAGLQGIDLSDAFISGDVSVYVVGGRSLRAHSLTVGKTLFIRKADLENGISLERAHVSGDVKIEALLRRPAPAPAGTSTSHKVQGPSFIQLERATISGGLFISETECDGALLEAARIDGDIKIDASSFSGRISAIALRVGGTLFLGNNDLANLDLTGATIGRDLSLLSWIGKEPRWQPGAQLSLRNATADAVCDSEGAWPEILDLEGFAFRRIASHGSARKPLPARDSASLIAWLARDRNASAQPYVQLARVLREAGQIPKSNDILYAARKRERVEAWRGGHWRKAALLWLLETTMGYGLGTARFFRAFWWVLGFVLAGVVILHFDQQLSGRALAAQSKTLAWMLFASLDAMLPIVSLDSSFSSAVPAKLVSIWSKAFFWVQGLVGWALGAFLAAGLAGLTQRPN